MALSIMYGGPGPSFLAPVVIEYLFGGIAMASVEASVDDVPDEKLKEKILKVLSLSLSLSLSPPPPPPPPPMKTYSACMALSVPLSFS